MQTVVVVGTQWGDEAKGKVTDVLAARADVVVRYMGGPNAGHTVWVGDAQFKLHLIPSGILYPNKRCVIGSGVALDPEILVAELDYLHQRGVSTERLAIADNAHLIMPYHVVLDHLEEERKGPARIGTTRRGVGPAYMDKLARVGIRVGDLLERATFEEKLHAALRDKNTLIQRIYEAEPLDEAAIRDRYLELAERIRPYVTDTSVLVNRAIDAGQRVLFEGAQGTFLDIDHGTYPYVTASHPVAAGACIGAGVGPTRIDYVIGVTKAYTTRVGEGPFPTELTDDTGERIRVRGHEYGTTTGRPRRVGWLDLVMIRYAVRISGIGGLAVTHLDTLGGLERVRVCTAYRRGAEEVLEFPHSLKVLAECEPVYEEFEGWPAELRGIRTLGDLPAPARRYLDRVAELAGVPVDLVSIGRERAQTVLVRDPFARAAAVPV